MWVVRIFVVIGLLLTLSPMLSVILSDWIASSHGCTLHEGFVNPCETAFGDLGPTLYRMFVSGWFMLFTMPIALAIVITWIVLELVGRSRRA